jgi:hypothetical protein
LGRDTGVTFTGTKVINGMPSCIQNGLLSFFGFLLFQDKKIILPSLLNVFRERYGTNIEAMSDGEFEEALRNSMNEIPELMP